VRLALTAVLATWLCWSAESPGKEVRYGYEVRERRPHSRSEFVQGLEIRGQRLYQGTGRWGESRLQVFDMANGRLIMQRHLAPDLFGEGITVLGESVFQLTWLARQAFIYRRDDLQLTGSFALPGQGWGMTNDGRRLIYSDGTATLRYLDPATGNATGSLEVRLSGEPLIYLNELEWTPQHIYANVWRSDEIFLIDEASGKVTGRVDLADLLPLQERDETTDVLNGIAIDHGTGHLWVTGKNWPWLYRIELHTKTR
jgi:glutamine cyclotransferase